MPNMKKDNELIIGRLREAMVKEELAIPLYTSHIEQTLFWSGLPAKKQEKIIENLKTLEKESEIHARVFQQILKIYNK
jgi:hypothetical protein